MTRGDWAVSALADGAAAFDWRGSADDGDEARHFADLALRTVYRGDPPASVRLGGAMPIAALSPLEWKIHPKALQHAIARPFGDATATGPAAMACLKADVAFWSQAQAGGSGSVTARCASQPSGAPITGREPLAIALIWSIRNGHDFQEAETLPSDLTMARFMALSLDVLVRLASQGKPYIGDGRNNVYARVDIPASQTLAAIGRRKLWDDAPASEQAASAAMRAIGAPHYAS